MITYRKQRSTEIVVAQLVKNLLAVLEIRRSIS